MVLGTWTHSQSSLLQRNLWSCIVITGAGKNEEQVSAKERKRKEVEEELHSARQQKQRHEKTD